VPVNDVGNKQFRNDLVSLLKAAWGVLEGVHDHEQSGVAVVESWRMDELEEELGKWGAWFSPSRSRKSLSRETRRGEMSDITKERKGELKAKLQKIHAGSWRTYMLITDQNIKDLIALMEVLPDKRSQVEKPIMRNDETYGEGRGYRAGKGAVILSRHDHALPSRLMGKDESPTPTTPTPAPS